MLLTVLGGCGGSSKDEGGDDAAAAGAWTVPREWVKATGFEASPVGSEIPLLIYQSRNYQNLLVIEPGNKEAWVLSLVDRKVFAIDRGRVSLTATGADVTSARPKEKSTFEKNGPDITFKVGDEAIRIYPWKPLVGEIPLSTLLLKKSEYATAAAQYAADSVAVGILRRERRPLTVLAFFGTWCATCNRHLPGLIRALELAGNPSLSTRFIGMDENLSTPKDLIDQYDVETTPTIIVLDGTRELGRIAGIPKTTMDRELAAIVAGEP